MHNFKFLFLLIVAAPTLKLAADDIVVPDDADHSAFTRQTNDFRAEFQCATAINTKFGHHNKFGPMGATEQLITPNLVTVPAIRHGKRGFYAMTSTHGVEFSVFDPQPEPESVTNIYLIETSDPIDQSRLVLQIDDSPGIGTTFYKAPPGYENGLPDKPVKLSSAVTNDADAENAILAVLTKDIEEAPRWARMCLNSSRNCDEEAVVKVLRAIVCGCAQHPTLGQAVEKLKSSPFAQQFKNKLFCEVAST